MKKFVTSSKDAKLVKNSKAKQLKLLEQELNQHLVEKTHTTVRVAWPESYTARRDRSRAAVDNRPPAMDDDECADRIRGGQDNIKPFLVGGKTQRRLVEPTRFEYPDRVGSYVAVWFTVGDVQIWEGDWAVAKVIGFKTVDGYEKVTVHWYGVKKHSKRGKTAHAKDGGPVFPGWGGEVYREKGEAGEDPHVTSVWFQSVLCWGLKFSSNKLPAKEIKRIKETVKSSIARWKREHASK